MVTPDGTGYTSGSPAMVGKKINNYELRELVGDGAMGVVYLAEHPVLRRRVAVKLLKRQYLESPSLVARFINEARAAAAIHHPNVIEVIDVGTVDADVPYIMMEFLEGEPLSRRLTRERLGSARRWTSRSSRRGRWRRRTRSRSFIATSSPRTCSWCPTRCRKGAKA